MGFENENENDHLEDRVILKRYGSHGYFKLVVDKNHVHTYQTTTNCNRKWRS
jgi:hypothetical protein